MSIKIRILPLYVITVMVKLCFALFRRAGPSATADTGNKLHKQDLGLDHSAAAGRIHRVNGEVTPQNQWLQNYRHFVGNNVISA